MTTLHSEAEYTAPHKFCPRPDLWHAWDSDSAEVEVAELIYGLVRAIQPEVVVETGTAVGHTAMRIGAALRQNGHGELLTFEVDASRAAIARDRCAGLPVAIFERSSLEPGEFFASPSPPQIGFALFDSLYELRAKEFRLYRQWMPPGTVVAFHDSTSKDRGHYWDVRADIRVLADEGLIQWVEIPSPRGLAIAQVC